MSQLKTKTILLALISIFTTSVQASVININYTGEVMSVSSGLTSEFTVGNSVLGAISYNMIGTASQPYPTATFYSDSLNSFSMTIGGYSATADGLNGLIQVFNDHPSGSSYYDILTFADYDGFTGNDVGGYSIQRLQLGLMTTILTTLTSQDLPNLTDLSTMFAANNDTTGNISFLAFSGGNTVRYSITSLTASITDDTGGEKNTIPEPGTLALFATGLLGFGIRKLRKN